MAWSSVRGHDLNVARLKTAERRGRLGHAWLFVGPPGVGKRKFAREFAKALFCEKPPEPLSACDRCPACKLADSETHPDFHIVRKPEEKQELPIDTIREFLREMGLKPSRGSRKIGFIEDAEAFNEESANAFLKTLEEPPPGSMLILRAESLETQLSTILSRCQPLRFHPLTDADVKAVLTDNQIDTATAERLSKMAGGSAGRAMALNDPAINDFRSQMLNLIVTPPFHGAAFAERWAKFVEEAGKDSTAQRERASLMLRLLIDSLIQALRMTVGSEATSHDAASLKPFAERLGTDMMIRVLEAAIDADRQVEQRVKIELILELLADRISNPKPL